MTSRPPDWAYDAVWYQVFPERFRNGSPMNDPRPEDIAERPPAGWHITPWGQDWYAQEPWEKARGDFYRSVFDRRFGGDLLGLREKLDDLQALGINALYLNPVFQAPSLHKYDANSLHHVDPTLGPDRKGDLRLLAEAGETEDPATWIWTAADRYLLDLVADVHARGMRIILDGVFNHCGRGFFAFRDLLKRGQDSPYRDWFRVEAWRPDGGFDYKGWFGHASLPEFARDEETLAEPVRRYIFDITRRWMAPDGEVARGIDGWRLDVAFCVPMGFWRAWREHVKAINPEAYLTAEICKDAAAYLQGDTFDAVMNYMWLLPALGFFSGSDRALDVETFRSRLDDLYARYPAACHGALQNLLDSHDTGRVLSLLENRCPPFEDWEAYFQYANAREQRAFKTRCPGVPARAALRQLAVFQAVFPGAPMLYYGTEVGLWGANDPDNRQPMLWPDVTYEPERFGPRAPCPSTPRRPDRTLLAFFTKLLDLRRRLPALRRGRFEWIELGAPRAFGIRRDHPDGGILALFNAGEDETVYELDRRGVDAWTDIPIAPGHVPLEPRDWRIIRVDRG